MRCIENPFKLPRLDWRGCLVGKSQTYPAIWILIFFFPLNKVLQVMYGMICCLAHGHLFHIMKNPAASSKLTVNLYSNELKLLSTLVVCNETIISEVELCLEQNRTKDVVLLSETFHTINTQRLFASVRICQFSKIRISLIVP